MKCLKPLNIFFHCLANGGSKCSPEPKLQEIREMLKSTKNVSLFGQLWGEEWVKMFTLTKVTENLMKCLNPLKFFFNVWPMRRGGPKCSPEPKLQEI